MAGHVFVRIAGRYPQLFRLNTCCAAVRRRLTGSGGSGIPVTVSAEDVRRQNLILWWWQCPRLLSVRYNRVGSERISGDLRDAGSMNVEELKDCGS